MTENNKPGQSNGRPRRANGMFTSTAGLALQFSVLLALAAFVFVLVRGLEQTLADKDTVIKEQTAMIEGRGEDSVRSLRGLNQVMETKPPGQDTEHVLSELVQARNEVAARRQDRDRLAKATKTLESIKRELQEVNISDTVEHAVNRLIGIATEVVVYEEAHGQQSGLQDKIAELSSLLQKRDQEIRKTKGLAESLERVMERARKVKQKPPCWVNAQTRKQEYIFDVAVLRGGFVVRDRQLPHRMADQVALPIKDIKFETFIGPNAFLALTSKIFAWSKTKDCRFFVRAFDATGAHDKEAYKVGMRILEGRFYRYEVRDETFSMQGVGSLPVTRKRKKAGLK